MLQARPRLDLVKACLRSTKKHPCAHPHARCHTVSVCRTVTHDSLSSICEEESMCPHDDVIFHARAHARTRSFLEAARKWDPVGSFRVSCRHRQGRESDGKEAGLEDCRFVLQVFCLLLARHLLCCSHHDTVWEVSDARSTFRGPVPE